MVRVPLSSWLVLGGQVAREAARKSLGGAAAVRPLLAASPASPWPALLSKRGASTAALVSAGRPLGRTFAAPRALGSLGFCTTTTTTEDGEDRRGGAADPKPAGEAEEVSAFEAEKRSKKGQAKRKKPAAAAAAPAMAAGDGGVDETEAPGPAEGGEDGVRGVAAENVVETDDDDEVVEEVDES